MSGAAQVNSYGFDPSRICRLFSEEYLVLWLLDGENPRLGKLVMSTILPFDRWQEIPHQDLYLERLARFARCEEC